MKLITEEVSQVKFITEKYKGKKRLCIEGVFLQGGIKNRNGRMYPVDILEMKSEDTIKLLSLKVEHLVNSVIPKVLQST